MCFCRDFLNQPPGRLHNRICAQSAFPLRLKNRNRNLSLSSIKAKTCLSSFQGLFIPPSLRLPEQFFVTATVSYELQMRVITGNILIEGGGRVGDSLRPPAVVFIVRVINQSLTILTVIVTSQHVTVGHCRPYVSPCGSMTWEWDIFKDTAYFKGNVCMYYVILIFTKSANRGRSHHLLPIQKH